MRIGILGSGLMGGKLGTIFARAGHEVVFSYARSEQKLKRLAREAGGKARAGTPRDAVLDADAVLLAVHWLRTNDVLKHTGDLSGKVIITCSLPMNEANTELVIASSSSGAEELARMAALELSHLHVISEAKNITGCRRPEHCRNRLPARLRKPAVLFPPVQEGSGGESEGI
jgi:predicted dinucleotide-binding enzyme